MAGTKDNPGMNLRSLTELFRLRAERSDDFDYTLKVSFYEIYNETIRDLLKPSDTDLKIRQSATGVYVEGLSERPVESQEDVIQAMTEGNANRTVGKTEMNSQSSRSHSILSVSVHGQSHVTGMTYVGKLHLIDLAGSERLSRSQATGERLKEAQAINLSLSSLGNCISALAKKEKHVPYRNSKLTHLLSDSIGGHAKTLMLVNVSPSADDADETSCSLQFASRVRATELGAATKNVTTTAPSSSASAASSSSGDSAPSTSSSAAGTSTPAKRPTSAAVGSSAVKARTTTATAGTASAVKKPAVAPPSATKKPIAK